MLIAATSMIGELKRILVLVDDVVVTWVGKEVHIETVGYHENNRSQGRRVLIFLKKIQLFAKEDKSKKKKWILNKCPESDKIYECTLRI